MLAVTFFSDASPSRRRSKQEAGHLTLQAANISISALFSATGYDVGTASFRVSTSDTLKLHSDTADDEDICHI